MTSSPTSSISGRPSGSHASTAAPSARACSSPRYTGKVGTPPTNAVHRSVPPEVENSQVEESSWSYTHLNPSGDSGDPVDPTATSASREQPSRGRISAFIHPEMNAALVPNVVIPASE